MNGRTTLAIAGMLVLACANQRPLPAPTVENYSYSKPDDVAVTHLDLDLTVDFDHKTMTGTASFDIDNKTASRVIYFDTWALRIDGVETDDNKNPRWTLGDSLELIGRPLSIAITRNTKRVIIRYRTTADARGVQWLSPEQTAGKEHPYLYTQSESIHARSWVPCQDTPSVRFTYSAHVRAPLGLLALMSASNPRAKTANGEYSFEMKQPIPSYLLALAVGDIDYRAISERSGVYTEPAGVDAAAWEFADLEKMISTAESLYGPYRWDQYDVLVLPPSFPYGGMENPRLTFATPTLIAGDRSLVSVVCHELAHSWSGNLVTNATWNDFWLNEGFTTYIERRLDEALYGKEYTDMQAMLGMRDLNLDFDEVGRDGPDAALYIKLDGRDPDETSTTIPYEKGYLFLRMLEESFGRDTFDAFLRKYFSEHAFQSMTTAKFVEYLKQELFKNDEKKYADLKVDEWIYKGGLPSNAPTITSKRFDQVDTQIAAFVKGTPAAKLKTTGWTTNEWQRFLDNLPEPQPVARLVDLEKTFHFNSANAVVERSWYPNVIAADWQASYPAIEHFLITIGRRYLVRPVYLKLAETPDGLAFARRVYAKARPGYQSLTQNGIDLVLKWNEAQADTTAP